MADDDNEPEAAGPELGDIAPTDTADEGIELDSPDSSEQDNTAENNQGAQDVTDTGPEAPPPYAPPRPYARPTNPDEAALQTDVEENKIANQGSAVATEKFGREQAALLGTLKTSLDVLAKQQQEADAKSEADASRYMTAYEQQKAAVAQMAVDPTGPIGRLTPSQAGGLSLAMFAQGFLAARGIHIDVGGQVDRWVDRSIHEQERQIAAAGERAKDQLTLWQIARETSRDKAEARQRYSGFVTQAIQTGLQQQAALFRSNVASANAQAANAQLQMKADQVKIGMHQQARQLALQSYHIQAEKEHLERADHIALLRALSEDEYRREQLKAKQPGSAGYLTVADPETREVRGANGERQSQIVTGYVVNPSLPKEVQTKLWEKGSKASEESRDYNEKLNRLIGARQKLDDEGGFDNLDRFKRKFGDESPAWQDYKQAQTDFVNTQIYRRSGKQINESEFERFFGMVPDQKMFQKGNSADLLYKMRETGVNEFKATMSDPSFIHLDDKGNPLPHGVQREPMQRTQAQNRMYFAPESHEPETVNTLSSKVLRGTDQAKTVEATDAWKAVMGTDVMPTDATFVEDIALAHLNPGEFRATFKDTKLGTMPEHDQLLGGEARASLEQIVGHSPDRAAALYAQALLDLMEKDPERARKLISVDAKYGVVTP